MNVVETRDFPKVLVNRRNVSIVFLNICNMSSFEATFCSKKTHEMNKGTSLSLLYDKFPAALTVLFV